MEIDPFRYEYTKAIQYLAESLQVARSMPEPDRIEIVRRYEQLAIVVQSAAARLMASWEPEDDSANLGNFENNMTLYEEMNVYDLLSEGWGMEYYSANHELSPVDERLFTSLLQIVLATTIAMEGYDLNKRALEALQLHASREPGRALARKWSQRFSWITEVMELDSSFDQP